MGGDIIYAVIESEGVRKLVELTVLVVNKAGTTIAERGENVYWINKGELIKPQAMLGHMQILKGSPFEHNEFNDKPEYDHQTMGLCFRIKCDSRLRNLKPVDLEPKFIPGAGGHMFWKD